MDEPKFPEGFVKEVCGAVKEARQYRKQFGNPPDPEEDEAYAQCDFRSQGFGLACTMCHVWLRRPYLGNKVDEEWLPLLEKYYKDFKEWDRLQNDTQGEVGAFI